MPPRPENHVTRAMDDARSEALARSMPEVPLDLITYLEALYPPVCWNGEGPIEQHLVYAGKQALVQSLRDHHQERVQAVMDDEERDAELRAFEQELSQEMEHAETAAQDLAGTQKET